MDPKRAALAGLVVWTAAAGALLHTGRGLYRDFQRVQQDDLRLERLTGRMDLLDEALTMSARMAASSGDADGAWERRYRRLDAELVPLSWELIDRASGIGEVAAARRVRLVADTLLAIENRSFALLRAGDAAGAAALLSGAVYGRHKAAYAGGVGEIRASLRAHAARTGRQFRNRMYAVGALTLAMLLALVAASAWIAALLNRALGERRALKESQRSLATLLSNLPGMVYRCRNDDDWTVEFVSEGSVALTGYTPEELMPGGAVTFGGLIHPGDQARVWEQVQAAVAGRAHFRLEYRLRTAEGDERWVWEQGQGIFADDGKLLALEGFVTDVTERRRADESIRLLAAIVESSDDAIISKGLDGTILSWNAGAERVYGYRADEAVGRSAAFLLAPERPDEEARILERVRAREQVERLETVRTRKDGSRIDVALTVSPLTDASDEVVGASVIARDITLSRRAREDLVRAKEEAEAANRAKSDFLSQMSHELRTPLNSVIGFANVVRKNKAGNLSEQELNYLDRIAANGKHLLGLINQILDLSKIEAGKLELEVAPVALDSLVHDTLATVQGAARPGVELRAAVPHSMAPLVADGARLKQVLINLVGNALKFTERGSVTVRVASDPATGTPLRIDVTDTGIGIPADRLGAIFRPFEQGDSGTTRSYEGTGLGLAISRSLCELMGYRLEVESESGVGSTFRLHLGAAGSAARADGAEPAAVLPPAPEDGPYDEGRATESMLVLVIDDETDARILLTHHLEELGCQTITASSGAQGLRMAREFRPDLITLDLLLPGTSGWEVLRALKADPELSGTPVVVVSVIAAESRGSVLGAVEVIDKPVERETLRALLRRNVRPHPARVLVVDDDADARELLAGILREEGAEIRTARGADEALRELESFTPDLVVLDLLMPGTDGFALLRLLRASDAYRHLPVVIVTARELAPNELRDLRSEALMVLPKARALEDDLRAVVKRLGGRQPGPAGVSYGRGIE